jgi:hypothetical protein
MAIDMCIEKIPVTKLQAENASYYPFVENKFQA